MAQDLGLVTAYGYAKEGGYTGTEAQFKALLGGLDGISSTVKADADRAESAADNAASDVKSQMQGYVDSASASAEEAKEAAQKAIDATPEGYDEMVERVEFLPNKTPIVYGFHIDGSKSNPDEMVTYLADAVGLTPAYMDFSGGYFNYGSWKDAFFMPKPCMLKNDGTVAYYLNPDDFTKKLDGTASDVADTSFPGNAMMEWPLIFVKIVPDSDDSSGSIYIANERVDDDYHPWGIVTQSECYSDHIYTPIYNGSLINSTLRSMSGQTVSSSLTATQEETYAEANGSNWTIETFADRSLINYLAVLISRSTNSQAKFGEGLNTGGSESVNNGFKTGVHNTKGLFYGTNSGTASTYTNAVKIFGMENPYGFHWRRLVGWTLVNGIQKVKQEAPYNFTGEGYTEISGSTPSGTSGGYISKMKFTKEGMFPVTISGSDSTYYPDALYFINSGTRVAIVGSVSIYGVRVGLFCSDLDAAVSNRGWNIGAAPSYHPLKTSHTDLLGASITPNMITEDSDYAKFAHAAGDYFFWKGRLTKCLFPIAVGDGISERKRNLLRCQYRPGYTVTNNGVTFTINPDYSITANGTANGNANLDLILLDTGFFLNYDTNYILTGCPTGGSETTFFLRIDSDFQIYLDDGNGISFKVPSSASNYKYGMNIRIVSGYTAQNLTFKPMIRLADEVSGYVPYGTANAEVTSLVEMIEDDRPIVYGMHINGNESDPDKMITYLLDAQGKDSAYMDFSKDEFNYGSWKNAFFMPRPCMIKQDGTFDYYLDPDDYTKKLDGTASDVADTSYQGNAMMQWGRGNGKRIWTKVVPSADGASCDMYFSNVQADSEFTCYNFMDENGDIADFFYTPIYNGSNINSVLRSMSGQIVSKSLDGTTEEAYAEANGEGWTIETFGDRDLINWLSVLISKSTASTEKFGQGLRSGGTEAINNAFKTGVHDKKGLFYGTNDGTSSNYENTIKIFGMENWYGFQWRRLLGWVLVDGAEKIKRTPPYNFVGNNFTDVSNATPSGTSGGYITKMKFTKEGALPTVTGGTQTTYYEDGFWFTNSGTRVAAVGGSSGNGVRVGLFCSSLDAAVSYRGWAVGAAPSYHPKSNGNSGLIERVEDVESKVNGIGEIYTYDGDIVDISIESTKTGSFHFDSKLPAGTYILQVYLSFSGYSTSVTGDMMFGTNFDYSQLSVPCLFPVGDAAKEVNVMFNAIGNINNISPNINCYNNTNETITLHLVKSANKAIRIK